MSQTDTQRDNKREKIDVEAGVVLIAPSNRKIEAKFHHDKLEMLKSGKSLRYIFQNSDIDSATVRRLISNQTIDLTNHEIYYVETAKFAKVLNGQYLNLNKFMPKNN